MDFEIKDGVLTKCLSDKENLVIPEGVKVIGTEAFEGVETLESVQIPESVELIEDGAFKGCTNLKEVILGKETRIEDNAFEFCDSLKADEEGFVEMNGYLIRIDSPAFMKDHLVIPERIHTVFGWCINSPRSHYETLELPETVKDVNPAAFFCQIGKVLIRDKNGKIIYSESFNDEFEEYLCEFEEFTFDLKDGELELEVEEILAEDIVQDCSEAEDNQGELNDDAVFFQGVNLENAKKKLFKGKDLSKVSAEKNRKFSTVVDGVEITVNYKPATKLKRIYNQLEEEAYYDPEEALDHILSPEEVSRRVNEWAYEQYGEKALNTDEYFATSPGVDTEAVEKLTEEEKFNRFICFAELCNRAANEEVLRAIAEIAEKKKNKTLYKNRVTPLIAFMGTSAGCSILELTAKAVSDTELEINLQERGFTKEEFQRLTGSPILDMLRTPEEKKTEATEKEIKKAQAEASKPSPKEQLRAELLSPQNKDDVKKAEEWLEYYEEDLTRNPQVEFEGHTFVFTGIDDTKDSPLVKLIQEKGGIVRGHVSGKTDYLIANPYHAGYTKPDAILDYVEEGKDKKIILFEDLFPLL